MAGLAAGSTTRVADLPKGTLAKRTPRGVDS